MDARRAPRRGSGVEPAGDLLVVEVVDDAQPDRLALACGSASAAATASSRPSSQASCGRGARLVVVAVAQSEPLARAAARGGRAARETSSRCRAIANSHGPAEPSASSRKRVRASHACANVSAVRSYAASSSRVRRAVEAVDARGVALVQLAERARVRARGGEQRRVASHPFGWVVIASPIVV